MNMMTFLPTKYFYQILLGHNVALTCCGTFTQNIVNTTELNLPLNFNKGNTLPQSGAVKVSCRPRAPNLWIGNSNDFKIIYSFEMIRIMSNQKKTMLPSRCCDPGILC